MKFIAILLVVAACLGIGHGAAVESDDEIDFLRLLPGLEEVYGRRYLPVSSLGLPESTPGPVAGDAATPTESTESVTVTLLVFDDASSAEVAWLTVTNGDVADLLFHGDGVAPEPIPDLGDQAALFSVPDDNGDAADATLLMRDGSLGFIIEAAGPGASAADTALAFAAFMAGTEAGDGDVTVNERGQLQGGVADLFPALGRDDALLGDLVPTFDYDLLNHGEEPLEAATPE